MTGVSSWERQREEGKGKRKMRGGMDKTDVACFCVYLCVFCHPIHHLCSHTHSHTKWGFILILLNVLKRKCLSVYK